MEKLTCWSSLFITVLVAAACRDSNLSSPGHLETARSKVVYGQDDRLDYYAHTNEKARLLTRESIVALIEPRRMTISGSTVTLNPKGTLEDEYGLCPGERFISQPVVASCSGVAIDHNLVLTAGHCVMDQQECEDYRYVFNYYYQGDGQLAPITTDDVYECDQLVVQYYSNNADYSILKLDRSLSAGHQAAAVQVADLPLAQSEALTMIGFPSGLPAKIDSGGQVMDPRANIRDYFEASTDSFHVNSGSGIFNSSGVLVGILVRGEPDYEYVRQDRCYIVNVLTPTSEQNEDATYVQRAIDALCAENWPSGLCNQPGEWCGDKACNNQETCESCPGDCHCGTDCTCPGTSTINQLTLNRYLCNSMNWFTLYDAANGWKGEFNNGQGIYLENKPTKAYHFYEFKAYRNSASTLWQVKLVGSSGYDSGWITKPSTAQYHQFDIPKAQLQGTYTIYLDNQSKQLALAFFDCATCTQTCASACGTIAPCQCGGCNCGHTCTANSCVYTACTGRVCGDDGCGGSCGGCPANHDCNALGQCICQPSCSGKVCGPNGCGGSCGGCPANHNCNRIGKCICTPNTCVGLGWACGTGPDGCGNNLNCNGCTSGYTCEQHQCHAVKDGGPATDGGPPPDGGASEDGGPSPDGGPPEDGGPSPDGGASEDGGASVDGGLSQDGGAIPDGGPPEDGGPTIDGGASVDGGLSQDGGAIPDGGPPEDGGPTIDGGSSPDGGVSVDGGLSLDGGVPEDGGAPPDGGGLQHECEHPGQFGPCLTRNIYQVCATGQNGRRYWHTMLCPVAYPVCSNDASLTAHLDGGPPRTFSPNCIMPPLSGKRGCAISNSGSSQGSLPVIMVLMLFFLRYFRKRG